MTTEIRTTALQMAVDLVGNDDTQKIIKIAEIFANFIENKQEPTDENASDDPTIEELIGKVAQAEPDPVYFIEKFICYSDPKCSFMEFKLRDYQKNLISSYSNKRVIVNSARQMGTTRTTAAYVMWYAITYPSSKIYVIKHNKPSLFHVNNDMRVALRFMECENPPFVQKSGPDSVILDNGSVITYGTPRNLIGAEYDLLWVDDASFISEMLYGVMHSAIFGGSGKVILTGSPNPNGKTGFFYDVFTDKENGFVKVKLPFYLNEEIDDMRISELIETYGERFASDFLCIFK